MRTTRSLVRALGLVATALLLVLVAPAPAGSAPYCGITWGSLAKSSAPLTTAPITNLRVGQHTCYDRMVIDLRGRAGGYSVRYVSQLHTQASGFVVPVSGGARLEVVVHAPAYDAEGHATFSPTRIPSVAGFRTFRQIVWLGSFEGYTGFGLGVRARLPFRVFTLSGPGSGSRLVIDVAHRW